MGKGDKKSKKGKLFMGSFGVSRKRKKSDTKNVAPKKAAVVVEKKESIKKEATAKKTTEKKVDAPKATAAKKTASPKKTTKKEE